MTRTVLRMKNANLRRFCRWVPMFGLALAAGIVSGCNTVEGIGQDIQSAATATRDAISDDSSADQPKTHSTNDGSKPGR